MPLNWSMFQRDTCNPQTALEACGALAGLSRWWLSPSALREVEKFQELGPVPPPRLPTHAGGCWVMIVNPDTSTHALLRPAFVLPLEWKAVSDAGQTHDPRLPSSLEVVANSVLQTLGSEERQGRHWRLHLADDELQTAPNLRVPDMDERLDAPSGWVSVAAGLWTAMQQTETLSSGSVSGTWATGCWDSSLGVTEVGEQTLDHKLELAAEFGAAIVYLPASHAVKRGQSHTALSGRKLAIGTLAMRETNWQKALGPYLAALETPPPPNADPKTVQALHGRKLLRLDADVRRADEFYRERLLSPIAVQCREKLTTLPGCPSSLPRVLVTVVSGNFGLVRLGIETLRATHCLAFHTTDKFIADKAVQVEDEHERFTRQKNGLNCKLKLQPFDLDPVAMLKTFRKQVEEFMRGPVAADDPAAIDDPAAVAFDVTPGTGLMTLAWPRIAHRDNWLIYLRHDLLPGVHRPDPFSESYLMWRAGDSWEHHTGVPQRSVLIQKEVT